MNCYYSNLIEGRSTKLQDIEEALTGGFHPDKHTRDLQMEALAHIKVQPAIDQMHAVDTLPNPISSQFIKWLHQSFYENASEEALIIKSEKREIIMTPGLFRCEGEEVFVANHLACKGGNVDRFMDYFEDRYKNIGGARLILSAAIAHHRLAYIHPFLDGNGRVSRLMSHAINLKAGIGSSGLWSISRGLARGLESKTEYRMMLMLADQPRKGDLDGRGERSRKLLIKFANWFLSVS